MSSSGAWEENKKKVAIVGGGLVGALQACFLAKRGYQVDVYEKRQDMRQQEATFGRSINLALSHRGREALRAVGAEEVVAKNGIPMYGRMIHDKNGGRHPIYYGKKTQYIMSVDRRCLNELLLTVSEQYSDLVRLHFEHKLVSCDFDKGSIVFEKNIGPGRGHTEMIDRQADLVIGCDGAYSAVRQQMMKTTRINFQQEYIPHGYIELYIPPSPDGQFAMEQNYLHIWPRQTFMLIALPNVKDKSFVATLFMPFEIFESLTTREKLLEFFQDKFPDALKLMGEDALVETFFKLKPLNLVSIKCDPYHIKDKAILLGDAAHAMVPFYGQGLNCGFEDLLVFDDLMEKYNEDFGKVLEEFSKHRKQDVQTMNDLAMYNYIEMRASVNSKLFLLRKYLDNFLFMLFPNSWIPLYTMVSFTRTRYHECLSQRLWQDKVLRRISVYGGLSLTVAMVIACKYYVPRSFLDYLADKLSKLDMNMLKAR